MKKITKTEWILRIGIFGSFLGHGVFALQVKQSWLSYFTAIGMSESLGATLLPLIGVMDVIVALIALFYPLRIVLAWAVAWGLWTALLRPIAGDPFWDFVERSANWAAPLALLSLQGFPRKFKDWFRVKN
ncbi:hypothetical protein HOI26_03660 [Candidatus Woesearchaeota archaeon]|nr:hypothetical protein [Candidatus Woesearchaeota archaeon]MBT5740173.1 hypothetical protein [Candidatus Woesearchaeota archaeon]